MSGPDATGAAGDVAITLDALAPGRAAAILADRGRRLGAPDAVAAPGLAALACLIGGERFALPLAAVAEVRAAPPPTPLPGAPAALLGLISARGTLYNLFDPAPALGLAGGAGAHVLLLRGAAPRIALLVDETTGSIAVRMEADGGDGLTEAAVAADGTRLGLIAVPRLIEALGVGRGRSS